jgi:adenosylcobinamide kinase/adenosylcobinamide-phosphate guanylyltransferase
MSLGLEESARLLPPITLVLGGARSGKSRFAEVLAERHPRGFSYLATAVAGDAEMAARIRAHQERRGPEWRTVEATLDVASALIGETATGQAVVVDCLTLWLGNLLEADRDPENEIDALVNAFGEFGGPVVFVSNEVGLGIVPDNALARAFRDHAGRLHQRLATIADQVFFVAAGLPFRLK